MASQCLPRTIPWFNCSALGYKQYTLLARFGGLAGTVRALGLGFRYACSRAEAAAPLRDSPRHRSNIEVIAWSMAVSGAALLGGL